MVRVFRVLLARRTGNTHEEGVSHGVDTTTKTENYLNNLKLGYVHHDGRDLAAVVALERLGHGRPKRARGAVMHLSEE